MNNPSQQRQPQQTLKIVQPNFNQPDAIYSQEAEEALIGALLVDPTRLDEIRFLEPADFFLLTMRYVYEAMIETATTGTVNTVSLADTLRRHKQLDRVGGLAELTRLANECESSIYATLWAGLIQRTSARRKLLGVAKQFYQAAQDESTSTDAVLDQAQSQLQAISAPLTAQHGLNAQEAIEAHIVATERLMQSERVQAVATGYPDIDYLLGGGFYPRRLSYLAGINHHGKTSMALAFALHALFEGKSVAIMNVADGNERDILDRMIAMESGLAPLQLQSGDIDIEGYKDYRNAAGKIAETSLYLASKKGMTMPDIYGHCAAAASQRRGLDIVFIDYLQRIGTVGKYDAYDRINKVSENLTRLAEKLNCPVVCCAQVNRGVLKRENKRPNRSDIEGSGRTEQDADIVLIVYKEDANTTPVAGADAVAMSPMELSIDKNKVSGQRGLVHLLQCPTSTKILSTVRNQ